MATYQVVVSVALERLDDNGALDWRGNARQTIVGSLPELQRTVAESSMANELAAHLLKAEEERQNA